MIQTKQIESAHLAANLAGMTGQRDLVVYLPPGYETSDKRYPTAYLLHDYHTRAAFWPYGPSLEFAAIHPPIQDVLDAAIAGGQPEMIVVMPDGWGKYGCSMWVDSPVNGNFEQFIIRDLVAYVDANFRTIAKAESRGVFGNGAGGFGAWHLASRNPTVFSAAALLSAESNFNLGLKSLFYRYFGSIFPKEPAGPTRTSMDSWMVYGYSAAFSPNPKNAPHPVDFPYHFPSGEVIPELWDRWLSFDPVVSWRSRQDNLRKLRGILLDVGTRDEGGLHYGHRILSKNLTSAGIAHEAREYEGTHTSKMYERIPLAYGWLGGVLAPADTKPVAGARAT
ncbi:MAG: hypothetical protein QOH08_1517 [Chloroflexota bacterium]|nr:hypothetical protein [Chloroflexota bacterium]